MPDINAKLLENLAAMTQAAQNQAAAIKTASTACDSANKLLQTPIVRGATEALKEIKPPVGDIFTLAQSAKTIAPDYTELEKMQKALFNSLMKL